MEEKIKELECKILSLEGIVSDLQMQISDIEVSLDGEQIINAINNSKGDRIDGNCIEITSRTLIENGVVKKSHLE